jgi:anaerobic ribonucleoside-triphosphate reductase activating protein
MFLRLHSFMPHSRANGPGARATVWLQGCSLGCPGCFNPQTHDPRAGTLVLAEELLAWIVGLGDSIQGITLSGGEPLEQRRPLAWLLARVKRETALSVVLFSGFTWDEIALRRNVGNNGDILEHVDVLVAGRYDRRRRLARGWRGSANQTVHLLTARYSLAELQGAPPAELLVLPGGEITLSGIDPLRLGGTEGDEGFAQVCAAAWRRQLESDLSKRGTR